ncbi:MAG: TIGR04076 family protein, partial [Kiritimatiellae bacterium]|nr:TIGR04076 family protein [Kiritimatiellia bacterium]
MVKITILKTTLDKELAAEYGIDGLAACPMMKAGDVFYADYAKPQGFCDEAWKAIYQYVFALAHGADKSLFYYGDWIKKPGVAIVNDIAPEHEMEKILYAVDELTGLLGAVVLMYPSKSAKDLNLKSVKKKFKDKKFAAG